MEYLNFNSFFWYSFGILDFFVCVCLWEGLTIAENTQLDLGKSPY